MSGEGTSGSGIAGQQALTDDTSDFNKMTFLVQSLLGRVRTAVVVKVMAVSTPGGLNPTGTVDVMPMANQIDGLGKSTPHATIFGVPYMRVQGGVRAVILDPVVGDLGLMGVCDRDISSVKQNRAQANPGSKRRFDLADGVYLGGMLNAAPEQYVMFDGDEIKVVSTVHVTIKAPLITLDGNVTCTQDFAVSGHMTGVGGSGTINLTVPIVSTAEITANGKTVSAHHHGGVQTGGGNTGTPIG